MSLMQQILRCLRRRPEAQLGLGFFDIAHPLFSSTWTWLFDIAYPLFSNDDSQAELIAAKRSVLTPTKKLNVLAAFALQVLCLDYVQSARES